MSRWIRVQTSIFDHELFAAAELSQREAWLWLIANVAWKETRHRIGNEVLDVPVGSMFVTLRSLQSAWHWGSDKRVRTFLSMLESERMIETKTDAGKTQITVCNYTRYQDVGRTEDASGTQAGRSADALKTPVHQDTSNTSSLRSDVCPEPEKSAPASSSPSVIDLPATQGQVIAITEADVAEWRDAFPAVDVPQQLRAMRQWLLANERNRKTARGMRKFIVSWLSRDQDRGGSRQQGHQSQAPPRKSAFQQHQDEIYRKLKRETGDRDDKFAGTTLDIGPGDYRPH